MSLLSPLRLACSGAGSLDVNSILQRKKRKVPTPKPVNPTPSSSSSSSSSNSKVDVKFKPGQEEEDCTSFVIWEI